MDDMIRNSDSVGDTFLVARDELISSRMTEPVGPLMGWGEPAQAEAFTSLKEAEVAALRQEVAALRQEAERREDEVATLRQEMLQFHAEEEELQQQHMHQTAAKLAR